MSMTEQEMLNVIEKAREWHFESAKTGDSTLRQLVGNILEVVEYQKGVGLEAWAENEYFKKENEYFKKELAKKDLEINVLTRAHGILKLMNKAGEDAQASVH